MLRLLSYASAIALLYTAPLSLAQQTTSEGATPAAGESSGPSFIRRQAQTQWRAPKLIGVAVYGADNNRVGKIDDVLIEHDGSAKVVVIGIGGFLGIGAKVVAVPFSSVHWRTVARVAPVTDPPPPVSTSPAAPPSNRPRLRLTDPAATEAAQGYPDKAFVDMTLAQLRAAPDFHYAPSPLETAADLAPNADTRPTTPGISY